MTKTVSFVDPESEYIHWDLHKTRVNINIVHHFKTSKEWATRGAPKPYQEYKHIQFILNASYYRPLETPGMIATCDKPDMAFFQLLPNCPDSAFSLISAPTYCCRLCIHWTWCTSHLCACRHYSAGKTVTGDIGSQQKVIAIRVKGLKRHNTRCNPGRNRSSFLIIHILKDENDGKRKWGNTMIRGGYSVSDVLVFVFRRAALPCCPLRSAPSQRFQSTGRWWSQPRGFPFPNQWHPRSQPWQTALLYRGHQRQQLWECTCKHQIS